MSAGEGDDAFTFVDRTDFQNLSTIDAEGPWNAAIKRCVPLDNDFRDDFDRRARMFKAKAHAESRHLTAVTRADLTAPLVDESSLYLTSPLGNLPRGAWCLGFGKRGCGKSWLTRYLVVRLILDNPNIRVAWIDLEDGAIGNEYAKRVLNSLDAASEARRQRQAAPGISGRTWRTLTAS